MDKTIFKLLWYEWQEKRLPLQLPREISVEEYLTLSPPKILVITGFRRVGKTYLLYSLVEKLLGRLSREDVFLLNLEDERIPPQTEFLSLLLPQLQQEARKEIRYLFLDEIQNIPLWDKWVRRIYDSGTIRLILSGSNSKLSSRELPTALRGRSLEIRVYPLSFSEFLTFKQLQINRQALAYSAAEQAKVVPAVREYLRFGGLPEVVLLPEEKKLETVQSYYQTVVQRDIIERYSIQNEEGLRALLRLLLNSTIYTISKLHNTLASMQHSMGKTTLQQYISYLEKAYFLYSVPYFSFTVKDQLQYPRKLYVVDNAFITALSTRFAKDWGRLYENLVFLELLRRHGQENIFYWKDYQGREVDFLVQQNEKVFQAINVCYDASAPETRARELRSLTKALEEFGLGEGVVITENEESEEIHKNKKVYFIPLWKWLING